MHVDLINSDLSRREPGEVNGQGNTSQRYIRLRYENPQGITDKGYVALQDYFDITLQSKGTTFLVDRMSSYPVTEPFYKDPKNANDSKAATDTATPDPNWFDASGLAGLLGVGAPAASPGSAAAATTGGAALQAVPAG